MVGSIPDISTFTMLAHDGSAIHGSLYDMTIGLNSIKIYRIRGYVDRQLRGCVLTDPAIDNAVHGLLR